MSRAGRWHAWHALPLLAMSAALPGCVAQRHADHLIQTATGATAAALAPLPAVDPAKGDPAIAVTDAMYFGQSVYQRRRGDILPERVNRVLLSSQAEVDLNGFASLITKATGIPIALNVAKSSGGITPAVASGGPGLPTGAAGGNRAFTMPVLWDGPLAGLLDLAAARFGVDWEYRDGVLQIADEKTETFMLHAMAPVASLDSELATTAGSQGAGGGGGGGGDGGSGGSTSSIGTSKINAGSKGTLDIWADVKAALAVIVGERGRFAVTPSNGTITVTGSPAILAQVAKYVRTQNAILERQVFVRVRVYAVNLAEGDDAALSFNGAFQSAAKAIGLKWASPGVAPTGALGSFSASVISSTSPVTGSDMVAKALASTTQTSLITELNLSALNNRPVSKQDVRSESYVSKTAVTNSQFTSTTELIPATLSTGFTLTLLPRIISENRLMLGYALNLSSLVRLERESAGTSFVQLPTVDSAGGMQDVLMHSGQVLMLMGYVADNALDQRQGTGISSNFLLGGSRSATAQKKRIVITMEPIITDGGD